MVSLSLAPTRASESLAPVLSLVQTVEQSPRPVKFDAAFIERRMRQHRQLQARMEREMLRYIIGEVLAVQDAAIAQQKEEARNVRLD